MEEAVHRHFPCIRVSVAGTVSSQMLSCHLYGAGCGGRKDFQERCKLSQAGPLGIHDVAANTAPGQTRSPQPFYDKDWALA